MLRFNVCGWSFWSPWPIHLQWSWKYIFADTDDDVEVIDFEYVEDVKGYAVSKRGRPLVDQRNYKYVMNRCSKTGGKAWWKCVAYKRLKCKATAISKQNKILKFGAEHNHPASDCYFREPALWQNLCIWLIRFCTNLDMNMN